jgi:6-phosphogluconate dehydrogenase
MRLGMIGLGKMGGNMAERLRRHGHEVVGYDAFDAEKSDVKSLSDLVGELGDPGTRLAWVMVPSGAPTDEVVTELAGLLAAGDIVVDGGNSRYTDSIRRAAELADRGIAFVDCGTSGGVWGLDNGYCLMVGGADDVVAKVRPAFDALAPEEGFAHVGPVGAGHYTKMVHNGIEYGLMQAYAEGVALLEKSELGIDTVAALSAWRQGSVVRSWLLDLLVGALVRSPDLHDIAPIAHDSGEGRWTVDESIRLGVATPVIAASLYARFSSQDERNLAMKVIAALRREFGGHAVDLTA